jgi:hypothetical protein
MRRALLRPICTLLTVVALSGCATRPPAVPRKHAWLLPWGAVDPDTMTRLFRFAEERVQSGNAWLSKPPGIGWRER